MQTITARELYSLAQQHSLPGTAIMTVPAPGRAMKPDCVALCEDGLERLAVALGVKVVHDRRQRKGERPEEPLSFEGDAE